jgi:uncharacterized membrane protein
MKKRGKPSDSGRSNLVLGSVTLTIGLVLLVRALFHVLWHRESSFLSDTMKALLIIAFGVFLFWARRKE